MYETSSFSTSSSTLGVVSSLYFSHLKSDEYEVVSHCSLLFFLIAVLICLYLKDNNAEQFLQMFTNHLDILFCKQPIQDFLSF